MNDDQNDIKSLENNTLTQENNDNIKLNNNIFIDILPTTKNDVHLNISENDEIVFGSKHYNVDLPVFKFIMNNPTSPFIPRELLENCVGETNYHHQTPLMLSVIIGNLNFIKQLIYYDIGKLDDYDKSALEYAYEFNASKDIIDILEEFEYSNNTNNTNNTVSI